MSTCSPCSSLEHSPSSIASVGPGQGCLDLAGGGWLRTVRVLLERQAVVVVDKTSGVDSRKVVRTGIGGARYEPIGAEAQRSEAAVMPRSARNIGLRLVHLTSFVLPSMSSSTAPRLAAVSLSALPIYALYQPLPSGLFVYTDNSTQRASYLDTRLRTVARGILHLSSIVSEIGAKTSVAFHLQLHEKLRGRYSIVARAKTTVRTPSRV